MSTFVPDKHYSTLIRLFFSSIETDDSFDAEIAGMGSPTTYPFGVSGFMLKGVWYGYRTVG